MATITLLTPEEIAERDRPKPRPRMGRQRSPERTRIIEEYKQVLEQTEPGWAGDVELASGEEKRVVRTNLAEAASELGKALDFRPRRDATRIYFRVITLEEKAARPKRGGRPRKVQQETAEGAEQPQAATKGRPRKRTTA